jgi:hypothetical protein
MPPRLCFHPQPQETPPSIPTEALSHPYAASRYSAPIQALAPCTRTAYPPAQVAAPGAPAGLQEWPPSAVRGPLLKPATPRCLPRRWLAQPDDEEDGFAHQASSLRLAIQPQPPSPLSGGNRELRCRAYREGPADSVTALILSRVTRMPSRLVRPRANPATIQYRRMSGVSASSNDSVTSVPAALGSSW